MKALLIDPTTRTVTEIQIEKGLQAKYDAMGCNMIEAPLQFKNGDILYCDEESKLKNVEDLTGGFTFVIDWWDIIVGKCLIVGTTREGNDADCKSTPDYFYNSFRGFRWSSKEEVIDHLRKIGLL